MDTFPYEQLLEQARAKLPERTSSGERFELPRFETFTQGSQTIVKNLADVASKLRREPQHLLKYISKELACIADMDGKRALLKGKFKADQLDSRLKNYVAEYVLCGQCGKPDTNFITVGSVRYKRCEVCGARAPVKSI